MVEITDKEEATMWPENISKTFIDIMVEEVNKGNMDKSNFTKKCWIAMEEEFKKRTKRNYNVHQLKQKMNRLRAKHREFSMLLNQTGFGWDATTNIVTATEENWQNYIKAHKQAKQFRKKGCKHFNLLSLIFNKTTATGALYHSSTQDPPNSDEEREIEEEFLTHRIRATNGNPSVSCSSSGAHAFHEANEAQGDSEMMANGGGSRRRPGSELLDRRNKKEARSNQMADCFRAWTKASKAKTETERAKAETERAKTERILAKTRSQEVSNDPFSIGNCIDILDEMDAIDDDTYLKALDEFSKPEKREMFIRIPMGRKKAWLHRL